MKTEPKFIYSIERIQLYNKYIKIASMRTTMWCDVRALCVYISPFSSCVFHSTFCFFFRSFNKHFYSSIQISVDKHHCKRRNCVWYKYRVRIRNKCTECVCECVRECESLIWNKMCVLCVYIRENRWKSLPRKTTHVNGFGSNNRTTQNKAVEKKERNGKKSVNFKHPKSIGSVTALTIKWYQSVAKRCFENISIIFGGRALLVAVFVCFLLSFLISLAFYQSTKHWNTQKILGKNFFNKKMY